MTQSPALKSGLNALLTPEESVLVLIDHQAFQFANLHSHEPTMIVNNVVALAKTAKVFNVPTILTTVLEDRGGKLIKPLQDVFPDGDRVTTYKTYHGTHRGEFFGVAPTGREIQFETVDVMRVRNGKITDHWGVANLFSLLQQLGAWPPAMAARS